jgi:transposase
VVIRRQGYRFLLKPTSSEEALLRQFLGCSRFVWNAIIAENDARFELGDPLPLYLPKIGWVAFRVSKRTRTIEGKVKSVTVRLESGRWYVAFLTEREVSEKNHPRPDEIVGIDVGVTWFAALSDGTFIDGPNTFKVNAKRLAFLQRRCYSSTRAIRLGHAVLVVTLTLKIGQRRRRSDALRAGLLSTPTQTLPGTY